MNLAVVLGSAGISSLLSLIALMSYLLSKRSKRVEHKFEISTPYMDKPIFVSAKGRTEAEAKARKLVRKRAEAETRDTRVTASAVLGQLAAGRSTEELLGDYPNLERADILAALESATAALQEREQAVAGSA